jgi:dienelactone hydrolase
MRRSLLLLATLLTPLAEAQPPGVTMEMIARQLPLEGAPLAVPGPYATVAVAAEGAARLLAFRPETLTAFPSSDTLPVVVWGNGGCAIENRQYDGFLGTIASHGFLVLTTVRVEGDEQGRRQTAEDLAAAIAWAEAENARAGSPLAGKIDTAHVAVMGQSCGGALSIRLGADPRVDSIIVFNSGLQGNQENGAFPAMDALKALHGPAAYINGGDVDFMYQPSRANFDAITQVPAFYGARSNAGHTATMYHPGGGEFANVASNWVRFHFKGNAEAGKMFVGADCGLCTLPTWETAAKGL